MARKIVKKNATLGRLNASLPPLKIIRFLAPVVVSFLEVLILLSTPEKGKKAEENEDDIEDGVR